MGQPNDPSASPADNEKDQGVTDSAAAPTAVDETPGSSPETGNDQPEESLGDVIGKALSGKSEEGEADATADQSEAEKSDTEAKAEEDGEKAKDEKAAKGESDSKEKPEAEDDNGEDVEEGQRVPYERFKSVINQKNSFREQAETLTRERDTYRQGHEQFEAITNYMKANELSVSDVTQALQIAATLNNDPAKAADMLAPIMERVNQFTGQVLPAELQNRVELGELTLADAQEIVRSRVAAAQANRQTERLRTTQQHDEEQRRVQELEDAMFNAAAAEEQRLMSSDPEWKKKLPLIQEKVPLMVAREKPQTAEQARDIVRRAHREASDYIRSILPQRRDIRPGPSSVDQGASAANAGREPQSMEEAIAGALRGAQS